MIAFYLIFPSAKQVVSFTQTLEDQSAKEKDTMVTFECETNEPFVKVKWLKNNVEIFSGDKYRMHSDRKVHFMSVLIINMSDEAEYSCVLADDDHISTTARLYVEGNCVKKKLTILDCILYMIAFRHSKPIFLYF